MGLRSFLRGDDITLQIDQPENRALDRGNVPMSWLPYSRTALLDVGKSNSLRVLDAYACIRCLADSIASLPAKVYRRTPAGRVPVGDDQRLAALLRQPTPGSTSSDLFSTIMVSLNVYGNSYIAKFRSTDGEVVQLSCLHPDRVTVESRGLNTVYRIDGRPEYGPRDVVHIRAMCGPGELIGQSPVQQCRLALGVNASLMESAKQQQENGPPGVLTLPEGTASDGVDSWRTQLRNELGLKAGKRHSLLAIAGETKWAPMGFSNSDAEFIQQRLLSAVEVCRIFGVPPWRIGATSPGSNTLTYSNVQQENLAFATHSLRPWLVRIERAFSNDPELCPGGSYLEFDLDGLLRSDPAQRAQIYTQALGDSTHPGWMSRAEIRDLESLPPEGGVTNG